MNPRNISLRSLLLALGLVVTLVVASPARAQTATFINPVVTTRDAADPWMIYREGFYYFTFTAGDHIEVWKSATITGIDHGEKVTVWQHHASGAECCNTWAPEIHFLDGRWYIYFTHGRVILRGGD